MNTQISDQPVPGLDACPSCGHRPTRAVALDRDGETGYDTYCAACDWSGEIWPDVPPGGKS